MRRREFITLLGGTTAASLPAFLSAGALAQQARIPTVGILGSPPAAEFAQAMGAFRDGLSEAGFVEGRTVVFEQRWAEGQYQRLPALAAELVGRQVNLIATVGPPASLAAKAATTAIPVVFVVGFDPVAGGLVTSLSRPGGNVTGVTLLSNELVQKRLEILLEIAPNAAVIGALINGANPNAAANVRDVEVAARVLGKQIEVARAATEGEIETAFGNLVARQVGAVLIGGDPFYYTRRVQLAALAARHRLPAVYYEREYAAAGGLISYGTNFLETFRQGGRYAGRILKGEKPADLPVMQPTKFALVIHLKTAKALGLTVPPQLLTIADEVIE